MKIKEGGVMDIQNNQTQELFEKLYVKNAPSWALERDSDGSYKYHATQSAFSLFEQQQAEIELLKSDLAKAQAVPDLSELQERIAGHQYYHDEHGHMIVDMDDVVKEISGFDSWKTQAVPEWVSVEDRLPPCDFEFCETGEYVSNVVLIHSAATYGFNMGMGHVNEDGFWSAYSGEHDFMNVLEVTHWMPLPDAPQEPAND